MTRQFSIVREPDMGHRWRLASCRVCFRSGAGAWEGLARALVFLGQMFQRGGGVQPAARPSFKCLFLVLLTFHGFGARLNWSGRSGSAHSADLCFIGYVFFWVDRGGLRPAARAALARILQ